ncbi:MAG: hypothetical protein ABSD62_11915 [Candidatus Limnocylindrales bacterium]|jgi:hypothetical protein
MSSPQDRPTTGTGGAADDVEALDKLAEASRLYDRYVRLARLTEIPALAAEDDAADLPPQDPPNTDRPFGLLLVHPAPYSAPPLGLSIRVTAE